MISRAEQSFQSLEALSSDSISWVDSHVNVCLGDHQKCSKAIASLLPSRILSLRSTSSGALEVLLVETQPGQKGVYACLSHRWGGSEAGRATRSSYPAMLERVEWQTIPRTFQDSLRFLLALGIENVWIDYYCIIQDDPLDWQNQAAQMASIYQNSYITLAATSSLNNSTADLQESLLVQLRDLGLDGT